MNWLAAAIILVIVELGLFLIVRLQRRSFPWLITGKDELPTLDSRALQKFVDGSFDPRLGWVRRPNTSGIEHGRNGEITFRIDSAGARSSTSAGSRPLVAAFGDSYVFCRQVEDDETWEAQLSRLEGFGVLNFGVGNYGLDQALLRYEGTTLPGTVRIVVIGFVPETICRIQSRWKHYLEFGNTFAFKPRFVLGPAGKLVLLDNPMQNAEDFASLRDKLPEIRMADGFYERKFRSLQFRFPYVFSLMRNPVKQVKLIHAVAFRGLLRIAGVSSAWSENLPFTLVMKDNIRDAHCLYRDSESTELLRAILLRFKEVAGRRGHLPLVLVMPQLLDLKLAGTEGAPYQDFYRKLSPVLHVIDLTETFLNTEHRELYINDQYGGHLSPAGNVEVAKQVSIRLRSLNLVP
ncbi:MAG: hypothetical protein ACREUB_05420 [Burkholderiales bacterium]